jgi:hypothetical protein
LTKKIITDYPQGGSPVTEPVHKGATTLRYVM